VGIESGISPKIAIALSGGGSRAIAFHLGCLRTLHALNILEGANVISTVSGGSVIGAMYATHEGTFDEFERQVRGLLKSGLVRPAIRTAFTTMEGLKAIVSVTMLIAAWVWLLPFRCMSGVVARLASDRQGGQIGVHSEKWMPRRFASRTTILRRTFDSLLFNGKVMGTLRTDPPKLVAIATELRSGSAFYFGRNDAGSWRFGNMDPSQVPVAHAVAASAAYPLLLPALDEFLTFRHRDGSLRKERVTLTDGGIYDNLGLCPLWPGRDRAVSIGVQDIDTIIACRAGYGLRMGSPSIFFKSRMAAAFGTVHARAQNATMNRLFDLKSAGIIKNFALPYLDQDDEKLAYAPADLIRRTAVADYPTDFSAMPAEWIEKLSKRGEQLTLAVIREHAPELLPPGWDWNSSLPRMPPRPNSSSPIPFAA
jgi:NTE family protein